VSLEFVGEILAKQVAHASVEIRKDSHQPVPVAVSHLLYLSASELEALEWLYMSASRSTFPMALLPHI
jgi:hypothetical protein